jgi:hypothetical protein
MFVIAMNNNGFLLLTSARPFAGLLCIVAFLI